jgi:hypothetical protein
MRQAAENALSENSRFTSLAGSAEATGLDGSSVDLIVAARHSIGSGLTKHGVSSPAYSSVRVAWHWYGINAMWNSLFNKNTTRLFVGKL